MRQLWSGVQGRAVGVGWTAELLRLPPCAATPSLPAAGGGGAEAGEDPDQAAEDWSQFLQSGLTTYYFPQMFRESMFFFEISKVCETCF